MNFINSTLHLLVNKKNKLNFILLIVLSLVTIFLEFLGLGLLVPLVSLLFDPLSIGVFLSKYQISFFTNWNLNEFNNYFNYLLVFIFFIFFIKNIYLIFYTRFIYKFLSRVEIDLSNKILENYLHQNFKFFIDHKSSSLLSRLTKDIDNFTKGTLFSVIVFFTEVLIIISFVVLVFVFQIENLLLIAGGFLFLGILFIKFLSSKSKKWGTLRQHVDAEKIKILNQIIFSIKEIILYAKKNVLFSNFNRNNEILTKVSAKQHASLFYPKLIFEIFAILAFVTILYFMVKSNYEKSYIISIMAFFLGATYRIIPSLNKIVTSLQAISYGSKTIQVLHKDFMLKNQISFQKNKIKFLDKILLKNITYSHNPNKIEYIFNNSNLTILKNQKIGIFGKSGIGKSTFADILSCLIKPQKGELYVDDTLIIGADLSRQWQNNISYVTQHTILLDDSILNNISLSSNAHDLELINKVINESVLNNFIDNLPEKINTQVGEIGNRLSGGQKQRIAIARALYQDRDFLIFDEATNAIDSDSEKIIFNNILNKKNITFVAITHHMHNLKNFDKIYFLENGIFKEFDY